ncbi:Predicted outer membrane protein [Nonomuraea solani]|uniref:Predicted outer membrane protein n=1 Tax=Nonomuraea solani TaxID=1144553 RepID=A0A1H6EJI8_9ACTN|nr:DUF4142 domain-containing protein [Nonomuraea solani]SEG97146.1 Predicted outer membrane protein [Nonomuraea solani]
MRTARKLATAGMAAVLPLTIAPIATPAQARSQAAPVTAVAPASTALHLSARDKAYLRAAHQGNLAEIAAGQAALRRSRDENVRGIAWRLIRDHRRFDARLREVADRFDVRLPRWPTSEQRDDLREVTDRPGRRFDRAWLRYQEDAHEYALWLGQRELRRGHSAWVKDLARDSAPVVRHHLRVIRAEL